MQRILVVGAGPTGLTLAAVLARHGVYARIIDAATTPPADRSRAIAIQARTLELFRDLGIDEKILEGALVTEAITVYLPSGKRQSFRIRPEWIDSRFNRIVSLPQDETERVLNELLTRDGVTIDRGVSLTAATEADGIVTCTLTDADGKQETASFDWIVGADGAHSAVRHAAGLPFNGETYIDEAMLGDVDIEWQLPDGEVAACPSGTGFLLAFPLPGVHRFRIIMIRPASAPSQERALSTDDFMASLNAMLPHVKSHPVLEKARWLTRYRLHRRGVPSYRKGRMFVAGDAAHIHSPVGAQGMNTGIQDAYNLGWKLALVARGEAPEWILESYNEERFPVGEKLLKGTDMMFGVLASSAFVSRALRIIMPGIMIRFISTGRFGRKLARLVSQTTIRYRRSSLVSDGSHASALPSDAPRAGDRLPDVQLADGSSLHDLVRGAVHTLVVFRPFADAPLDTRIAAINAEFGEQLRILRLTREESTTRFGTADGSIYLVRPDKHIGFRGTFDDLDELRAALRARLIATHRTLEQSGMQEAR